MDNPDSDIDRDEAARMMLEPDAFHEEDGLSIDCPQCGAAASVIDIVEEGQCPGYADEGETEDAGGSPREGGCGAKLALELVWSK